MDGFKKITLDGKEYELVPVEENQERKTGWERIADDNVYYYSNFFLENNWNYDENDESDDKFFLNGNYRNDNIYQDKEINNIANKLSNISESILTEIIPKLKNNIDSN